MNIAVLILLLSFSGDKARLGLSAKRKQKYQNGNIHRKLRVPTSVILNLAVLTGVLVDLNNITKPRIHMCMWA
jgi:hypothetical protein